MSKNKNKYGSSYIPGNHRQDSCFCLNRKRSVCSENHLFKICSRGISFSPEKLFISKWVNVNAVDYLGKTPLHYAARNGFLDIVEFLISRGANPKSVDFSGNTPIHEVGYNLNALISVGAWSADCFVQIQKTIATDLFMVLFLVKSGADFYAENKDGKRFLDIVPILSGITIADTARCRSETRLLDFSNLLKRIPEAERAFLHASVSADEFSKPLTATPRPAAKRL